MKRQIKVVALPIVLMVLAAFAGDILFGFTKMNLNKCDEIYIFWVKDLNTHASTNFAVKKQDDPDLFDNLINAVAKCKYHTKLNQSDGPSYGHDLNGAYYQMSFYDASERKLILKYTIFSDGIIIVDDKFMAYGLLSDCSPEKTFRLLEDLTKHTTEISNRKTGELR